MLVPVETNDLMMIIYPEPRSSCTYLILEIRMGEDSALSSIMGPFGLETCIPSYGHSDAASQCTILVYRSGILRWRMTPDEWCRADDAHEPANPYRDLE